MHAPAAPGAVNASKSPVYRTSCGMVSGWI